MLWNLTSVVIQVVFPEYDLMLTAVLIFRAATSALYGFYAGI